VEIDKIEMKTLNETYLKTVANTESFIQFMDKME